MTCTTVYATVKSWLRALKRSRNGVWLYLYLMLYLSIFFKAFYFPPYSERIEKIILEFSLFLVSAKSIAERLQLAKKGGAHK